MTIGEIHKRILELDILLVRADMRQIPMEWEEYQAFVEEADGLMDLLAKTTSELNEQSYEEMYTLFYKQRVLTRMSAIAERHLELHPESNPKHDAIVSSAFQAIHNGTKTPEQGINECMSIFAYLVEDGPKPPRKGFFGKLFGWYSYYIDL